MPSFQSRYIAACAAVVAFATISATSAQALTYDLQFSGGSVTGTGSVSFDTTSAPLTNPYEFRAGDTFIASFDFGSVVIDFTELHATNPVQIPHAAGAPSDVFYAGSRDELSGDDLGFITFISFLSFPMGEGTSQLGFLTNDGFEITIDGEYTLLQDGTEVPVPAPGAALLFASGLAALAWSRRRRA